MLFSMNGSVLLHLQPPKGGCCSISVDLSCYCQMLFHVSDLKGTVPIDEDIE